MKNKKFDCVEMKKRAQEGVYAEIKGMSAVEELAYWKGQEQAFRKEPGKTKNRAPRKPKTAHV